MTKRSNDDDNETNSDQIVDENTAPGTRSQSGTTDNLQYNLASERNRLRWEYQEMYEKAEIEEHINESVAVKERRAICQAVNMSEIILNIQEALHSGIEHDLPKAIENLKKLLTEPFTTVSLLYAPSVVKAVYLCCRYEKSDEIRSLAKECYRRFEPCFGVPDGGTFETAFQTEVREFWEEQNTVLYDSSKYNWAHFTMDDDTYVENENNIEAEDDEKMEVELNPNKNDIKLKIENIKIKTEPDDKAAIKNEIKREPLDNKRLIKKEMFLKTETADNKTLVKKEIKMKVECKTDTNGFPFDCKAIKEEVMDTDYEVIEITYPNIKPEDISALPKLSVKLEPIDLEKLNAVYNSDDDCYILN